MATKLTQNVTWARKMVPRPEPDARRDEGHEQADAHQDLGDDERHVDEGVMKALEPAPAEPVEGERRRRPQDDGQGRGADGDEERVAGGPPDLRLVEELGVPPQGKSLPAGPEARGVEGVDDEDDDRQVEEEHRPDRDRRWGRRLRLMRSPRGSPALPALRWRKRMATSGARTDRMRTTDRALARGRLRSTKTRWAILLPIISPPGPADDVGDDVGAQGGDEDEEDGGDEAPADARAGRPCGRRERPRPEVPGRFHEPEIEFLGRGVDGQDGERQERVDRDQDHGRRPCREAEAPDGTRPRKTRTCLIGPFRVEERLPGEDPDEEVRPEGDDDEHQEEVPPFRGDPGEGVADGDREERGR